MSDYPAYSVVAAANNPCAVHEWNRSDHGTFTNRAVEWFVFACPHCGTKVRIDVQDWPLGTATEPAPPPTDAKELAAAVKASKVHA